MTLQDITPVDAMYMAAYLLNTPSFTLSKRYRSKCIRFLKHNKDITVDDLRVKACQKADTAYWFAFYVDECFHYDTYQACLGSLEKLYQMYVMKIDVNKE